MLGPNGAGKTTTIEVLEGLRPPNSGKVEVFGLDVVHHPEAIKQRIGVQLQTVSLYPRLTVTELLDLFGSFYHNHVPTKQLIDAVDLGRARPSPFDEPVRRPAAAPLDRPGPGQRSGAGLPRRADHRPRPPGSPLAVGPGEGPPGAGASR